MIAKAVAMRAKLTQQFDIALKDAKGAGTMRAPDPPAASGDGTLGALYRRNYTAANATTRVAEAQREIDVLFDSHVWRRERVRALLPYEACALRASREGRSSDGCAATAGALARGRLALGLGGVALLRRCVMAPLNRPYQSCAFNGSAALRLRERPSLVPGGSSFAEDLQTAPPRIAKFVAPRAGARPLGRRAAVIWLGDSLVRAWWEAATCDVERALGPHNPRAQQYASRLRFAGLTETEKMHGGTSEGIMARVAAAAKEAHASGGGLLVANLGVHYSPQQQEGDRRERKPKNEASAWDRSRLRQHLGVLLQLLDAFGGACPRSLRHVRRRTSTFRRRRARGRRARCGTSPTAAGRRTARCVRTNCPTGRHPPRPPRRRLRCRALPTPSPPLDANPTVAQRRAAASCATSRPPPTAAGGARRRAASRRCHVHFVPLHLATATLWDAHLGVARDGRQADCTHYCPAPFLWEPLWGALGEAAFVG